MTECNECRCAKITLYALAATRKPLPRFNFCDSNCPDRMEDEPQPIETMPDRWSHEYIYFWLNHCDSATCRDRISKVDRNPYLLPKTV